MSLYYLTSPTSSFAAISGHMIHKYKIKLELLKTIAKLDDKYLRHPRDPEQGKRKRVDRWMDLFIIVLMIFLGGQPKLLWQVPIPQITGAH